MSKIKTALFAASDTVSEDEPLVVDATVQPFPKTTDWVVVVPVTERVPSVWILVLIVVAAYTVTNEEKINTATNNAAEAYLLFWI